MNEQILLIDDEPDILKSLSEILLLEGFQVRTASSGKEALEILKTEPFDLVITDITLPGIDGNAVAKCIRNSKRPEVPIVAMSGYNDKADGELFDFMLSKPFNLKELMAVVREIEGENEAHLT